MMPTQMLQAASYLKDLPAVATRVEASVIAEACHAYFEWASK